MNRSLEIRRIRERLQRLHSPRLQMFLIVALTAAAGFLASSALRDIGMSVLWQRYALAVAVAYLMFLLLLRAWVRLHDKSLVDGIDVGYGGSDGGGCAPARGGSRDPDWAPGGGRSGGGGASTQYSTQYRDGHNVASTRDLTPADDATDLLPDDLPDLGELGLVAVALCILCIAAFSALWMVWIAPALLAELILDVALASGLYRRLRRIDSASWLRTALRRTFWPFVLVLVMFAAIGAGAQAHDPTVDSIGDLFAARSGDAR